MKKSVICSSRYVYTNGNHTFSEQTFLARWSQDCVILHNFLHSQCFQTTQFRFFFPAPRQNACLLYWLNVHVTCSVISNFVILLLGEILKT